MSASSLLLPDLTVRGFRGLDSLTIPRMGGVTLLTGRNGVGKTSVLEAIRIYASRGRRFELEDILASSDESSMSEMSDDGASVVPDWLALFFGRRLSDDAGITIGPTDGIDALRIVSSKLTGKELDRYYHFAGPEEPVRAIRVESDDIDNIVGFFPQEVWIPQRMRHLSRELPKPITCLSLGPGLLDNSILARWWDNITLTPDETRVEEALSLVTGRIVNGITIVGKSRFGRRPPGRIHRDTIRPLIKFKDEDGRVPLRSLGDGALRVFSIAVALANSRDGFLLIDEAENGLHYSAQRALWNMILRTAVSNNVQVIATTHSFDCIRGFSDAANDYTDANTRLVRLSRLSNRIEAIDYPKQDLAIAAERFIEVR